jgi:uncharacterized membrane protein (DUF485 family)
MKKITFTLQAIAMFVSGFLFAETMSDSSLLAVGVLLTAIILTVVGVTFLEPEEG